MINIFPKKISLKMRLYISFFLIPAICALSIISFNKMLPLSSAQQKDGPFCSTGYVVLAENGEKVGYVMGALHQGLTETQLTTWQKNIQELVSSIDELYLEIPISPLYPLGSERKLMEIVLQEDLSNQHNIRVAGLDSPGGQQALVIAIQQFGPWVYQIPVSYDFAYNHESVSKLISHWFSIAHAPINLAYNLVNPEFAQHRAQQSSEQLHIMLKQFLKGQFQIPKELALQYEMLKLSERDKAMFEKFKQNHPVFSQDSLFMICIGAAHLAHPEGILSLFTKEGFILEPINLTLTPQ